MSLGSLLIRKTRILLTSQTEWFLQAVLESINPTDLEQMARSSILMPGWSVEIGAFTNDEAVGVNLQGTIVTGLLDLRGVVNVHGAILSTYRPVVDEGPLFYGGEPDAFNTTIGYFGPEHGDGEGVDESSKPFAGYGRISLRANSEAITSRRCALANYNRCRFNDVSGGVLMRRGFTLPEVLIALAISALLLAGLFASLHGTVDAYRRSAAEGVNRLTARLLVERIALLVRTGVAFGPLPNVATETEVESDVLEITTADGQEVEIEWDSVNELLIMSVDGNSSTVLGGVVQTIGGESIAPFLLQYENGTILQRVTINLAVDPDPEHATAMDGGDERIRFTTSVMPRGQLY